MKASKVFFLLAGEEIGRTSYDIIITSWCDAGQQNRPGRASGLAPKDFLTVEECTVAIINWKSCKVPRQYLGSNGAEVQALTEAEETTFKLRAVWAELHGTVLRKHTLYSQIRDLTCGVLIMVEFLMRQHAMSHQCMV